MPTIEERLELIEERNRRVEGDKAWEISRTRLFLLAFFIYLVTGFYLWITEVSEPWINASGAAVGFVIGTLTMPFLKRIWIRRFYKK